VTVARFLVAAVAVFAAPVMFAHQTRDYTKFNVCEFIPGDAIARSVGATLTRSRPTFDKNWSRCAYYVTDANGKPTGYVVWIQPAEDFEDLKKIIEKPITPVRGLGDAAFVFQDDDRRFKLNVLKRGDLMLQATADTPELARKVAETVLAIVSKKQIACTLTRSAKPRMPLRPFHRMR
jgi:hypothetical protein